MRALFLEQPLLLFLLLGGAQFLLLVLWARRRTPAAARAVWIGFAAIAALMSLSILVVTPRERAILMAERLARAVESENVGLVAAHIHGSFETEGLDADGVIEHIEKAFDRFDIRGLRLSQFEVLRRTGGGSPGWESGATIEFTAGAAVSSDRGARGRVVTRWRLTLVDFQGDWRVSKIEAIPTAFSPIRSARDWIR